MHQWACPDFKNAPNCGLQFTPCWRAERRSTTLISRLIFLSYAATLIDKYPSIITCNKHGEKNVGFNELLNIVLRRTSSNHKDGKTLSKSAGKAYISLGKAYVCMYVCMAGILVTRWSSLVASWPLK